MVVWIKLLLLASLLLVKVYTKITRLPQCDKFSATFKVQKLRLIDSSSVNHLEKIKDVENKERCSTLCVGNSECVSAIYQNYDNGKKCVLYDHKIETSKMKKSDKVFYMTTDDEQEVSLMHGHACSEGRCHKERTERCEENCQTQDGYKCFCKQDGVLKDKYCKPLPVDGAWRQWGSWSSCSQSCGGGQETRRRSCDPPAFGGNDCISANTEQERPCNQDPCPDPMYVRCQNTCKTAACATEMEPRVGCNKQFSCVQACKIRQLGKTEQECKALCIKPSNPDCPRTVNGYTFSLCASCPGLSCATYPPLEECEIGCQSYI
ncbi:uncharacterized protein [Clytia hemisphaerica]|uniref:Apple domain-containing protein n=1 Tax=Clytia hemisphaerica TaxID=252671 RepID=A0A7M5X7G4_9CNID